MNCFLYNFHLMVISMLDRLKAKAMLNLLSRVLDSISLQWKHATISEFIDGARNMTGGLTTRIQNLFDLGVIRVWCGLHRLDIVMQGVYYSHLDDNFCSTLIAPIEHL